MFRAHVWFLPKVGNWVVDDQLVPHFNQGRSADGVLGTENLALGVQIGGRHKEKKSFFQTA